MLNQPRLEEVKLNAPPPDDNWRSFPIDHWLENLSNPEGKSYEALKQELLLEVEKLILDDKLKDPGEKAGRPRKRIKVAPTEIPREALESFFDDDHNEEEFGLKSPLDYQMLKDLMLEYREKEDLLSKDDVVTFSEKDVSLALSNLEGCSASYCANFLREFNARAGERPCRHGNKCIYMLLANKYPDNFNSAQSDEGFICREFLLPSELETWKKEEKLPVMKKLCLGCNRLLTTTWHYECLKDKVDSSRLIQDHYNITGEDGGYSTSACIYPNVDPDHPPRIIRPIIEFKPEFYIYGKVIMGGEVSKRRVKLRCVRESKVGF